MKTSKGFTLTELLVSASIIGILTAIALPSYITARMRAGVSREYANLRTVGTALETYRTDNTEYPLAAFPLMPDGSGGFTNPSKFKRLKPLTTPTSYISRIPEDSFSPNNPPENVTNYLDRESYFSSKRYVNDRPAVAGLDIEYFTKKRKEWIVMSYGPSKERPEMLDGFNDNDLYSPTNSTKSLGLITKVGP